MQLLKLTMRTIWDVEFRVYKSGSLSFRETSWTFEMKLKLKLPPGMRNVEYNCVQTLDGVKLKRPGKAEGAL